jgi:hypothetical protein
MKPAPGAEPRGVAGAALDIAWRAAAAREFGSKEGGLARDFGFAGAGDWVRDWVRDLDLAAEGVLALVAAVGSVMGRRSLHNPGRLALSFGGIIA